MPEVPKRWKGACVEGEDFSSGVCNKKLIGARYFFKGLLDDAIDYNASAARDALKSLQYLSARDTVGHGTHTASTAAGAFVNANFMGFANGTASGGAPRSHLAIYRVCWEDSCNSIDIVAGIDHAIEDGVDIISMSLGAEDTDYDDDPIALAGLKAVSKGIAVVAAAGNAGEYGTVSNTPPWFIGDMDRELTAYLRLSNGMSFKGPSLSNGTNGWHPIILGSQAGYDHIDIEKRRLCDIGTLDPDKCRGKIVVCYYGGHSEVGANTKPGTKSQVVLEAGGVGMVLFGYHRFGTLADPHFVPTVRLDGEEALRLNAFLVNSTCAYPLAYISGTRERLDDKRHSPGMAGYSSRGPSHVNPAIIKPDVIAPGTNILAAVPPTIPVILGTSDPRRTNYRIMSGTSMACPQVSAIVALLRSYHPDWSPAAIRSALVTTGFTGGGLKHATPMDYGGGHVDPNAAAHPGLVYDLDPSHYQGVLCGLYRTRMQKSQCHTIIEPSQLNYPSIGVSDFWKKKVITRSVTNVGFDSSVYTVSVNAPKGINVTVDPATLAFTHIGQVKAFNVTLVKASHEVGPAVFGSLTWSDGWHNVRSPISVSFKH